MSTEAKLLVVDDEFNILELLATSLRFAGFEVVTAGNGREALEKAHAENPDLPDRKGRHRRQGDRSGCRW